MEEKQKLVTTDSICNRVYVIRGQQVMLDYDLAELYGYEVKRLNEQVKRNINRFPKDFMFQLTKEEVPDIFSKSQIAILIDTKKESGLDSDENLKSQIATSSWGGRRKLPYAFTEQGIYMLATVLKGELAEQQSIFIMRAFREMRHYIKQNQQFVTQAEMRLVTAKVSEMSAQMAGLSDRQIKTEQEVKNIQKSIDAINENFISDKDFKNFVIYKGQNGFLTTTVVDDFKNQYPPLHVKQNPDCHDRWIVLDYGTPGEQVYHCGASSKDAGKKLCAINKIEKPEILHPVISKLLVGEDKEV